VTVEGELRRRTTDGARILVIEDSDDLRHLMDLALRDAGYTVDCAALAEDGIRMLETNSYRLVLSDYSLPGHSGEWLLSQAIDRNLLRGAPALLITADPDAPGISDRVPVVAKPVNFDYLLPQIRTLLTSTGTSSPALS
jgi:DNA-binding response OmpR family regulator